MGLRKTTVFLPGTHAVLRVSLGEDKALKDGHMERVQGLALRVQGLALRV